MSYTGSAAPTMLCACPLHARVGANCRSLVLQAKHNETASESSVTILVIRGTKTVSQKVHGLGKTFVHLYTDMKYLSCFGHMFRHMQDLSAMLISCDRTSLAL